MEVSKLSPTPKPGSVCLVSGAPLHRLLITSAHVNAPTARDGAIESHGEEGPLSEIIADVKPASDSARSQGIDATLKERGSRYGSFVGHAAIAQDMKAVMRLTLNWDGLDTDQKEALEMIAHKIARILNGDPNYHDSWHDIVGYTKLVADRLLGIKQ